MCFTLGPAERCSRRFEAVLKGGGRGGTRGGREVCVGVVSSCLCRCACQHIALFFLTCWSGALPVHPFVLPLPRRCHSVCAFLLGFALPTPSLSPAPPLQTVPSVICAHSSRHAVSGQKRPLTSPGGWAASCRVPMWALGWGQPAAASRRGRRCDGGPDPPLKKQPNAARVGGRAEYARGCAGSCLHRHAVQESGETDAAGAVPAVRGEEGQQSKIRAACATIIYYA